MDSNLIKDHETRKGYPSFIGIEHGDTTCCGIEELNFQALAEVYDDYSERRWEELVAKYIKGSCERDDERVVFVGLPTEVGTHSMYNIKFYRKLRNTLKEFGFRELCKPYKNRNSQNTIIVLAGQMPG